MTSLAYLSATEALAAFRARILSPIELTEALIAQSERGEPDINALTYRFFDQARDAARQAEACYMSRSGTPRPLEGLCVAVKDAGHVAGQPTSGGSLLWDDSPQPMTSPINQRVLDAGGIVHARTATPEFSCASITWSRKWGVTRNPWNSAMTPGGSSGGAGAALASGQTPLATGSDIGGSIRIPASCCGVVGYKPPRGRNPVDAPFNLDHYCHTGPMARTVADTLLFQNCLSGPHPDDATTLPRHVITQPNPDLRGMRIALSPDLGFFPVTSEIRTAFHATAQVFADLGAHVEEVALPWGPEVIDAALTHLRMIFGTSIAPSQQADWAQMTDYAAAFARAGLEVTPRDYLRALTIEGQTAQSLGSIFKDFDLLLAPTTATPALEATFDPAHDPLVIGGVEVDPMIGWVLTAPFNMLSTHPVLSVPMGLSQSAVPMGLQIVARPFADDSVFRAGLAYEAARGPWFNPGSDLCPF